MQSFSSIFILHCVIRIYNFPENLQVLIFSEKKAEVDDIHEYLLLKGVEAVSIHGGKGKCTYVCPAKIETKFNVLMQVLFLRHEAPLYIITLPSTRPTHTHRGILGMHVQQGLVASKANKQHGSFYQHSELKITHLILFTDQEERQWAIKEFKSQRKDVLVATDIAGKGLDFPNIQHVINYDMPADIENYGLYLNVVRTCCNLVVILCSSSHWQNG